MNPEFKRCLEKKQIKPFARAKGLIQKELNSADRDLEWARDSRQRQNLKWCIVQAYYAMFHAARALLFSKGYAEKSHFCLYAAIRELFQKPGIMENALVDDLYLAMSLRQDADYEDEFSEKGADTALESATKFIQRTKEILI